MKTSVWSLTCQRSVFQRYYSEKHLSEFYPQDSGESQLASKLRHCRPLYRPTCYIQAKKFRESRFSYIYTCQIFNFLISFISTLPLKNGSCVARYLSSRMLIRFIWQWIHSTQYYFWRRVGRPFLHKKMTINNRNSHKIVIACTFSHSDFYNFAFTFIHSSASTAKKKKLSSSLDDELWSRSSNLTYRGPGVKMMNHLPNI